MNRTLFDALPESLRENCSAFEPQFAQWVLQRSGDPELARAALALALAQAAGHVGVAITADGAVPELPGFTPALALAAVADSAWVAQTDAGWAQAPRPFVLERGRFYSWRSWQAEMRVAAALRARLAQETAPVDTAARSALAAAWLPRPNSAEASDPAADQRAALLAAGGRALYTLTGGPGTGKTATVLKLLLLAVLEAGPGQPLRIALAAPTGKAAQRLAQAIVAGKTELLAMHPQAAARWAPALAQIPEHAATVHRLLGLRPAEALAPPGEPPPVLSLDLLVIDEASMLDLDLMDQLLAQLAPATRLLLLGDADQLSAVGTGSVLADLVADGRAVGRLRHVFRAHGSLVTLANRLREGTVAPVLALLSSGPDPGLRWRNLSRAAELPALLLSWASRPGRALLTTLAEDGTSPTAALAALTQWRILAAVREGPFGVLALNRLLSAWVAEQVGQRGALWFHGRVVLITRNHLSLGLYNGDVGICLRELAPDSGGTLRVWFPGETAGAPPRNFAPRQLPEHEDGWALTVHKSQGSEYDDVLLVLPPDPAQPLLRRELLYTGATRARRSLEIWAGEAALRTAIERRAERSSGLLGRLGGSKA